MTRPSKATFMTGSEYREALKALGLSLENSVSFLQIDRSTAYRRASEDVGISFETAALLRLMLRLHITPTQVARIVDKA